ncbi:MAG: carbon-nitrogen hydrolase family protein [Litorimonas sp.]
MATAQSEITSNLDINARNIQQLIQRAAEAGADIVHFPEGALSGCVKTQIRDWNEFDWQDLEEQLSNIARLCGKLGIWAVIGSAHNEHNRHRPFNSLYIIDDTGKLAKRYDKRYCSHSEITDWYVAGISPITIEVKGIKLGFALCIEIQFPEIFQEYEQLNVDCVLLSAYSESPMFAIQAQGHAACNNIWMSYSVPRNLSRAQASCMIAPDGNVLGTCENNKDDITLHEINPNAPQWDIPCQKARPWRRKARLGDIY